VLLVNFGDQESKYALKISEQLRSYGVSTELFPDAVKLKKQMSYADAKKIPYIIMAGEDEIKNNEITIKIMSSGEQKKIALNDLVPFVKEEIAKTMKKAKQINPDI
jgi:histidyl-tRNA synthetase